MTPAERITAAIGRLEQLKADSTQGEWTHVGEGVTYSKRRLMATGDSYRPMTRAEYLSPADAGLIVTLHRTIDAQIAILKLALLRLRTNLGESAKGYGVEMQATFDLADAILGES